jgi:hypothetical protein
MPADQLVKRRRRACGRLLRWCICLGSAGCLPDQLIEAVMLGGPPTNGSELAERLAHPAYPSVIGSKPAG